MNLEFKHLLNKDFAPESRVWIYQASRLFSIGEALQVEEMLENFTKHWKSHGKPVTGSANLFFGQFIVIMADEKATGVSGCSTDSSVRLIKEIEKRFEVDMFDRMTLAFQVKDGVQLLPMTQIQYAVDNNFISADTIYFNNTIQTKKELEDHWLVALKDSWLMRRITITV